MKNLIIKGNVMIQKVIFFIVLAQITPCIYSMENNHKITIPTTKIKEALSPIRFSAYVSAFGILASILGATVLVIESNNYTSVIALGVTACVFAGSVGLAEKGINMFNSIIELYQ
jgi:hypothetical protein